jgi:hypothetical protein
MSFNPKGSKPSSREAEVLERQRLMASRMAASNKTNDKPSNETAEHKRHKQTITTKGVGTSERPILIGGEITAEMALEHARRHVAAKRNQQPSMSYDDKKKPSTNKTTSQPASSSKLKRPTMRRTASSLAKASNRTNNVASGEETSKPSAILESTSTSATGAAAGSLSSLLLSNADTAKYLKPNAPKLLQHYDKIEPDQ